MKPQHSRTSCIQGRWDSEKKIYGTKQFLRFLWPVSEIVSKRAAWSTREKSRKPQLQSNTAQFKQAKTYQKIRVLLAAFSTCSNPRFHHSLTSALWILCGSFRLHLTTKIWFGKRAGALQKPQSIKPVPFCFQSTQTRSRKPESTNKVNPEDTYWMEEVGISPFNAQNKACREGEHSELFCRTQISPYRLHLCI